MECGWQRHWDGHFIAGVLPCPRWTTIFLSSERFRITFLPKQVCWRYIKTTSSHWKVFSAKIYLCWAYNTSLTVFFSGILKMLLCCFVIDGSHYHLNSFVWNVLIFMVYYFRIFSQVLSRFDDLEFLSMCTGIWASWTCDHNIFSPKFVSLLQCLSTRLRLFKIPQLPISPSLVWVFCLQIYASCALLTLKAKYLITGVTDSCELLCGYWELYSDLLRKLPMLLTAEPFLQPLP